jgi:hypothetical protein
MNSDAPTDADLKRIRDEVVADPTSLRLRFQLGAALCIHQKYYEAIPELEKGMCYPQQRLTAMMLLITAYEATSKPDLAVKMRAQLSRESGDDGGEGLAPVPVPK